MFPLSRFSKVSILCCVGLLLLLSTTSATESLQNTSDLGLDVDEALLELEPARNFDRLFQVSPFERSTGSKSAAIDPALDERIDRALNAFANGGADPIVIVNPFIGTEANYNPGNVFPGSAVPFSMAKIGVDIDAYAPAGYVDNVTAPVRGMSLLHDSGTGSSLGSMGNFESMPIVCKGDKFQACPTSLDARKRNRTPGKDNASPGYFTLTLDNGIKMETTSTRRAGLLRYTWPNSLLQQSGSKPHVVFDWTNDLPGSFSGGRIDIDWSRGRMMMNGSWESSFGPAPPTYRAFACYDLLNNGKQTLSAKGLWTADRHGQDDKTPDGTHREFTSHDLTRQFQSGSLVGFDKADQVADGTQVLLRVGVSYVSADQACRNAEEEISQWDFKAVQQQSRALWSEKLRRVSIDAKTDRKVVELFYSSLMRQFLSPNNATHEGQREFLNTAAPYYDGLYCTWDTFRTFFPFLSLHSPYDFADIAATYVDGYVKTGIIPECRANNLPGYTQGGSDGTNVLGHFAVTYSQHAQQLGVDMDTLYKALLNDATVTPANWASGGREIDAYLRYGYIPCCGAPTKSKGIKTREASRTSEYSYNDFAIRQVALIRGDEATVHAMTNRSYFYRNNFDHSQESEGFKTFLNKRKADGSFVEQDPTFCTPDNYGECSMQSDNPYGVYESSSWEYSFWAPHDVAGIISIISQNNTRLFIDRIDHFFKQGYYNVGNEPSFVIPTLYHYANQPIRSVQRVREVVYESFGTTTGGLPGNDDNGAMATLLLFHLCGLFPVASTREMLIVSPFMPSYTFHNALLGDLTVRVTNFDPKTLSKTIPAGARAYVQTVKINGVTQTSRCKVKIEDLFPGNGKAATILELTMTADAALANSCGPNLADLPSSLSTGGFDKV